MELPDKIVIEISDDYVKVSAFKSKEGKLLEAQPYKFILTPGANVQECISTAINNQINSLNNP